MQRIVPSVWSELFESRSGTGSAIDRHDVMRQEARIPSNRMPAYVARRTGVVGWLLLVALGAAFIYLCISTPAFIGLTLIIATIGWVLNAVEKRRQQRMAAERREESICSFVRTFDCRTTDTWIIRAVFEEITAYVRFPIRADDRLEDDLKIDPDDVDDLAEAIAQRTRRPLDHCEQNPLYGKVKTVGELVGFFVHQPRRSTLLHNRP